MECRPEAVATLIEQVVAELEEQVQRMVAALEELAAGPQLLEQLESLVRGGLGVVGQQLLEGLVAAVLGTGKAEQTPRCAQCGEPLRYVRTRERTIKTLVGPIRLPRAYYHCPSCRRGVVPLEEQLGRTASTLSRALQEALCRLAVDLPFESARQLLSELLSVEVDDNTIQRVVQQTGAVVQAQQAQLVQQVWEEAAPPAAEGAAPQRLYLSVDGTTVHLEEGWKEVKVAALYETEAVYRPDAPAAQRATNLSYVVSFDGATDFAQAVYVEAARRGLHAAAEVVVLGDGAHWIWQHIADFCDAPVEILDYYHAREHLWQAAHARYGEGSPLAEAWVNSLLDLLFEEGPDAFLHRLWQTAHETWDEVRAVMLATLTYFTNNRARIDYRALRAAGYHIGSGTVESACKRVIGARLKQAGMRWSRDGAAAVAALRATFLSDRWDEFWHSEAAFTLAA